MTETKRSLYQAREFARMAGVTVRTLHHYDRLGLLKPSSYTDAGYRLYAERDFARLQQIVTLKFIGVSLKQIKRLLDRHDFDLKGTLQLQRRVIEEQRCHLDTVIQAIERAERSIVAGGRSDWEAFTKIIEVINMHKDTNWTDKFYSEEARAALAEKRRTTPQEEIEKGQREWAKLIPEVEAAASGGEDPTSEHAQGLAARWKELVASFTGGNPAIQEGLNKMYADKANWPPTMPRPFSDETMAFIRKAMAGRTK